MLPEAGQRFGPYEILARVGGGGMGVVFRAWDERLHRAVAVKLLHNEFRAPGMRERFLLEARAASALNHPYICTIFDIGEQDGEPYLVMELLEGQTLKERIAQSACSSEEIVRFSAEVADALAAAHAKGIVHRDVKPANIFLQRKPGGESQVKVLDFGLAKISMALRSGRDSRALELTSAGSTVGTLAYMSPEQARGESIDARSDLFSLGIVMYEMATRRTPFRGATTALAFQSLLGGAPDPIRTWNPAIPRELERIILRSLAKDRAERYQSARETLEALRKLAARGDGDWLRRQPKASVPLVPAADPVVRKGWGRRGKTEPALPVESATSSSIEEDGSFLRPRRMPLRESGSRAIHLGEPTPPGLRTADEAAARVAPVQDGSGTDQKRSGPAERAAGGPGSRADAAIASVAEEAQQADAVKSLNKVAFGGKAPAAEESAAGRTSTEQMPAAMAAAAIVPVPETVTHPPMPLPEAGGSSASDVRAVSAGEGDRLASEPVGTLPVAAAATESGSARQAEARGSAESVPVTAGARTDALQARRRTSSGSQTVMGAAAAVEEGNAGGVEAERPPKTRLRTWLVLAAALAVVMGGLAAYLLRSGSLGQVVLGPKDTILLAPLMNRTGDATLDGSVMEGVEIELEQRSTLPWLGLSALRAGMNRVAREQHVPAETVTARAAAQRLGARVYLYGEITRDGEGYRLRVDVLDAASNDRLGSVAEAAGGRKELPAAITRLSALLRSKLGEGTPSERLSASTPVEQQATGDMEALGLASKGEAAAADGDMRAAETFYEQAMAADPAFSLAALRLAWLYQREGAEVTAGQMAGRAAALATRAGDRVAGLARVADDLLHAQDPGRGAASARQLVHARPRDPEALLALSQAMLAGGHMTEALLSAEQALRLDPLRAEAYEAAAAAQIGLDRYKEALAMKAKAAELGVRCDCGETLARYLSGTAQSVPAGSPQAAMQTALVLDDAGRFEDGLRAWQATANEAQARAGLASAAAGILAQAALDRALANRCGEAERLTQEAAALSYGRRAAFHIALANELCSSPGGRARPAEPETRLLQDARLQSLAVTQMVPVLRATEALNGREPAQALAVLSKIGMERDPTPLVLYLRGVAHHAGTQEELAEQDFREVARRRGYALLTGGTVAVLAEHRLAEVLAGEGNLTDSRNAEDRFHQLWTAGMAEGPVRLLPGSGRPPR